MNETRRQAYLSAMGIDVYFPRYTLPGARPSNIPAPFSEPDNQIDIVSPVDDAPANETLCDVKAAAHLPERVNPHKVTEKPGSGEVDESGRLLTRTNDLTTEAAIGTAAQVERAGESVSGAGEQTAADNLRFKLQYYRINDHLAVLNEIPYLQKDQRVNDLMRSLLLAILKALEINVTELSAPEVFSWPLTTEPGSQAVTGSDALQVLQGFLRKRFESCDASVLLVFAGQFEGLLGRDGGAEAVLSSSKARLVVTRNLDAVLKVPELKKLVWQDIRALRTLRTFEGTLNPTN